MSESLLTWDWATTLEPDLAILDHDLAEGKATLGQIIVGRRLVELVGRGARHPRLRTSEAYGLVYDTLKEAERRARVRRATAPRGFHPQELRVLRSIMPLPGAGRTAGKCD